MLGPPLVAEKLQATRWEAGRWGGGRVPLVETSDLEVGNSGFRVQMRGTCREHGLVVTAGTIAHWLIQLALTITSWSFSASLYPPLMSLKGPLVALISIGISSPPHAVVLPVPTPTCSVCAVQQWSHCFVVTDSPDGSAAQSKAVFASTTGL